jgi:oligopeptide transport system permease protein
MLDRAGAHHNNAEVDRSTSGGSLNIMTAPASTSLLRQRLRQFWQRLPASARRAAWVLAFLSVWFALAPFTSPYNARSPDWDRPASAPALSHQHYFGTDAIGRDLYQRTAAGGKLSMMVGLAAALVALLIGTLYGALAGFVGGSLGDAMMRLVDLLATLPFLLFVIFVLTLFTPSLTLLILLLASYGWLDVARVVRFEAQTLMQQTYMRAGEVLGLSKPRQLFVHLLPNLAPFALLALALALPNAVLMESFLSFLGVSPAEAQGSLGSLLADGMQDRDFAPWGLLFPAATLTLLLYLLQELTDGLRTALQVERA